MNQHFLKCNLPQATRPPTLLSLPADLTTSSTATHSVLHSLFLPTSGDSRPLLLSSRHIRTYKHLFELHVGVPILPATLISFHGLADSSSLSSPPSSTLSEPGQEQSSRGREHQRYRGSSFSLARSRTPSSATSAIRAGSTFSMPTPSASSLPTPPAPTHSPSPSPSSVPCSVPATSPHTKAWSAVIARLASSPNDDPTTALHLFDSILRRLPSPLSFDARPGTATLKAYANLGVYLVYLRWHFSRIRKRNLGLEKKRLSGRQRIRQNSL
ncbi:hypothetical protein J5N97_013480 [Dioscorea zingiberensis]|uniref:Uncharacterized protein n=1 Tax=Dioscorea zingiberensis TaxID=325984 RepID=A0A9D5CQM6_9LILI|nr:hypothetical protein J5N97_013480 [Dioscorea zingiberensis]